MRVTIKSKDTSTKTINLNRRRAIRERCFDCSDWSAKEVSECLHTDCPLYPFRLGRGKQSAKERNRAIRDYCLWCMNGSGYEVSKCVSPTCPLFAYRLTRVDRSVEIAGGQKQAGSNA